MNNLTMLFLDKNLTNRLTGIINENQPCFLNRHDFKILLSIKPNPTLFKADFSAFRKIFKIDNLNYGKNKRWIDR